MTPGSVDLVIDRLAVDGLELAPGQAVELARLTEAELRRVLDRGEGRPGAPAASGEDEAVMAHGRADLGVLARLLAERIAAELGGRP